MKDLDLFIENIFNEGRRPKEKDVEKIVGKDAEKNGTKGKFGIDEPTDNDAIPDLLPEDQWNDNMQQLKLRFIAEKGFFIIGEAGWGKTSIIKQFAKKYKRRVITIYLDKCEATDLGGIPVATKDEKTGRARRESLMPEWAQYMLDRPNDKFLLFFDEMNQAAPDVMNALMPIFLDHTICGVKFKNFFAGAAGNFDYENDAVSALSKPLKSRVAPVIEWESKTTKSWERAMAFIRKSFKDKLPDEYLDIVNNMVNLFDNPREVVYNFLDYVTKLIEAKENVPVDIWHKHISGLIEGYKDLSRTQKEDVQKLSEATHKLVANGGNISSNNDKESGRGSRKGQDMIDENIKNIVRFVMKYGYCDQEENGKKVRYGVSKENINPDMFASGENMNKEMLDRLIAKFEADGVTWKFEKDSEWKAKGYKDPDAELLINVDLAKLNIKNKQSEESNQKRNSRRRKNYNND